MDLPDNIVVDEALREKIKTWTHPDAGHEDELVARIIREIVEFLVMVAVMWLLLRAFEVEPFVIPTGSMAPTLMGRHMDVECAQCGYAYQTGASEENGNADGQRPRSMVIRTTCPVCRYEMTLDREQDANQRSFTGDRILVSKLAYQFGDPERWDVAVFKYPGNPKINYIKRLVGLPGEALMIRHGDLYVKQDGGEYQIARKPPGSLVAMLRVVDDTDHVAKALREMDWPSRWNAWPHDAEGASSWSVEDDGTFTLGNASDNSAWLRYRHMVPDEHDWRDISAGRAPRGKSRELGQLITNFVAYNRPEYNGPTNSSSDDTVCWVGDLAVECDVQVQDGSGNLELDLVEGGVHYTCTFDLSTGAAELSIGGDTARGPWGAGETNSENPVAETKVAGPGTYNLRLTNCDDELRLWVDGKLIEFDRMTTYRPPPNVKPKWTQDDPLDMAPAGIGGSNVSLRVTRLRVLRDIYYLAKKYDDRNYFGAEYERHFHDMDEFLRYPQRWEEGETPFDFRRSAEFTLGSNQYFALGDNSPASQDARVWSKNFGSGYVPPAYIDGRFLTGKAFMVYWPHTWNRPVPFWPNFERIGFIR